MTSLEPALLTAAEPEGGTPGAPPPHDDEIRKRQRKRGQSAHAVLNSLYRALGRLPLMPDKLRYPRGRASGSGGGLVAGAIYHLGVSSLLEQL